MRILSMVILFAALAPSPAQAIPSLSLLWKDGTPGDRSLLEASPGDEVVVDIVLTGVFGLPVNGVFISVGFDNGELEAIRGFEIPIVNLPGMGNTFSPIVPGVEIDNGLGQVERFEQATLSLGLAAPESRTLGSVTFRVLNPGGTPGEQDVRVTLGNAGIDAIVMGATTIEATTPGLTNAFEFHPAEVVAQMPEPSVSLLIAMGLMAFGCAGRRAR